MEQQAATRRRRTREELVAALDEKIDAQNQTIKKCEEQKVTAIQELDAKIAAAKARIKAMEQRKKDIMTPKQPKPRTSKKQKIQDILKKASKSGLSVEEIAERLGMNVEA